MNKVIRIAQVLENMNNGGVESVVMNYYRNIDKSKIQFDFIVSEKSIIPQRDEILELGGRIYTVPSYKNIFKYIKTLKKIFKENKYEIVHSHINTMSIFPLYAAKKSGVKIRIAHSHSQANYKELLKSLLKNILKHFSKLYSNRYFACSYAAGEYQFGKKTVINNQVYIMKNAIDKEKFKYNEVIRNEMRKKYDIKDDEIVYLHIGRFDKAKNHKYLIKIFNKILNNNKKAKLVLVGNGDEFISIRNMVYELNINKNVIFTKEVNDPSYYYQMADVFYFPSIYEGLGMVLIEAQSCGLQCLTSTNVPKEAKISDLVTYLYLENPNDWINYKIKNIDRTKYDNILDNSNYEIKKESEKLMEKYFSLLK